MEALHGWRVVCEPAVHVPQPALDQAREGRGPEEYLPRLHGPFGRTDDTTDAAQLSLVSWRDHFFRSCQAELTSAILKVIERHRNGETVDNALLEKLVESLVALGIDEADINRQNLEVYKEAFERPFIAATEQYYRAESEAYIADNSVNDYMKKAEQRLKEEEQRVDMYLHPSSRKIVRRARPCAG